MGSGNLKLLSLPRALVECGMQTTKIISDSIGQALYWVLSASGPLRLAPLWVQVMGGLRNLVWVVAGLASGATIAPVVAQELPVTSLKILGGLSTRSNYKQVEQPFWLKTIPEHSAGQITAEIKGFDEMGLKGPELLKLMRQGVIGFGVIPLIYPAADTAIYEAIDLAGLATDAKTARQVSTSFAPILAKHLSATYQSKFLGVSPFAPQVLFCNVPIRGLQDLKDKTVRVITRSQAELIEALGAKSISMPFAEVMQAFQKKTIACAVASSMAGYTAKWYTVSTHLYALPLGWNQEMHAVNQKVWDQLNADVRALLEINLAKLTERLWLFAESENQKGYDCNTGAKTCPMAPKGKMTLVRPTQADLATIKRLATQNIVSKWATRCSGTCVSEFNQTIGKSLKITAKKS
jgi:TRAP-type C4-dicarboxylate transport system substrate-binding protein